MTPEAKLAAMGLTLPEIPRPLANYVPYKINGNTLYLSGQGPRRNDGSMATGKVGRDVTVEQAYEHAKLVGLGLLAAAKAAAGDLAKIVRGLSASGDLVVCLGAGNITQWAYALPGELAALGAVA